jgi:hypothetical protein
VHDLNSFFRSFGYFGKTVVKFINRMRGHGDYGKDLTKFDTIPIAFCTADDKKKAGEDAKKLEAVAIWICKSIMTFLLILTLF